MSQAGRAFQEKQEEAQFHYDNCEIEQENDRDSGTTAWCIEHEVDVTECLPDAPEWDYEAGAEFEEALNAGKN